MILLGDKICLDGFDDLSLASLTVVKKMVGSFARKLDEEKGYDRLEIAKMGDTVRVKSFAAENAYEAESSGSNIFFTLSKSLNELNMAHPGRH